MSKITRHFFIVFFSLSALFNTVFGCELGIVSMFRNEALYFKEWIDYHILIGVEHFWLYNDGSTDDFEAVLEPYIEQGIVEVLPVYQGEPEWVSRQVASFRDGIQKAKGVAKWIALIDQDEFLVPMEDKTITECLKKHFSQASLVYANWRNFGTGRVILSSGDSMIANLVSCSLKNHARNCVGKSILQPEHVDFNNMWSPHFCILNEGFLYANGDGENTFTTRGLDLVSDGQNHFKYIGIHHYVCRDKKYFEEVKLPLYKGKNPELLIEMEEEFNLLKNYKILEVLKKYHPEEYEKNWKGPHDKKVRFK